MSIIYKVAEEWAAPTFYELGTRKELYDECDQSIQALWVISYDTEEDEVVEWLERFYPGEEEEALARAKELNEKGE
jgi:hypothetical protein